MGILGCTRQVLCEKGGGDYVLAKMREDRKVRWHRMNKHQEQSRKDLNEWLHCSIREQIVCCYRGFRDMGVSKREALVFAKEWVQMQLNAEARRNFEGPRHLLRA